MKFSHDSPHSPIRGGKKRELKNPHVIRSIGNTIREYKIEKVALHLKKSPQSLYNEISEFGDQSRAKLSLDDSIEATRMTQDITWLKMIAADFGFRIVPNGEPDKDTVAEESAQDIVYLGEFTRIVNDEHATREEVVRASSAVREEIAETATLKIRKIAEKREEEKERLAGK